MKVLFVRPNKDAFGFKPIGLSLLSAIARSLRWQTRLFDTTGIDLGFVDNTQSGETAKIFKPVDLSPYGHEKKHVDMDASFAATLDEYKPDCLAISVLSDEITIADRLATLAKRKCPSLPIIFGGKYPTLNPEKTLAVHGADFACLGEGLDAFRDFLQALSDQGKDLYSIPNIWAKRGDTIVKNNIRPLRMDLDGLPYVDWDIFDRCQFYKPFDGHVYVGGDHMLNWGCPYHCTYCVNHFTHELYDNRYLMRRYSVGRIIAELKFLKDRYGLQFIKFHDEDFLMRPLESLRALSRNYRQEVGLPFVIETNPKSVTEEKVELLKYMNCASASLGIETGDATLRKTLLKRVDTETDIVRAYSLLKSAGIRTASFNMLGIPYESRETYRATVELNRKAGVQYPNIGFFYPFEGTMLRDISIEQGFFDPGEQEDNVFRRDKPALRFPNLTEGELIEMRNAFVLYVKLPDRYAPFIRRSENQDNVGRRLRRKLLEAYDELVWANDGWYDDRGREDQYVRDLEAILHEGQST